MWTTNLTNCANFAYYHLKTFLIMAENTFDEYGKVQAIDLLFEGSGFDRQERPCFEPAAGSSVCSVLRLFVEGMDFDLTYFPLKHLGYKSVVAVAGEIYAAMSHPRLLSVRLGVSAKLDFNHVKDLWGGVDRKSVV